MWGEGDWDIKEYVEQRITPTSVGRSVTDVTHLHPPIGLPPLVWGEAKLSYMLSDTPRITPTSVGRSLGLA